MTLKKILEMWVHDYTPLYISTTVTVHSNRNGKLYFLMKFAHGVQEPLLKEKFLNRKVVSFSVTETELQVAIDLHTEGIDHECISGKEFYSLLDKACIDLSGSEEWVEELKDDNEESIKYFEWNHYHNSLSVTFANIPHYMPGWEVKKYDC